MNSSAETHVLERKPASPWKFCPGAMWRTWQSSESPLRFPSVISYNTSGLVLFFCSDWKKTPGQHLGHKPAFFPDWCCLVKPGFLAKRGAIYLYLCLFLSYLFIWFNSNTGLYLRIAIIKYVHVTHRECYKYIYFFFFYHKQLPFLWSVSLFSSFPLECTGELQPKLPQSLCPSHELGCCSIWGGGDSSRAVMGAQGWDSRRLQQWESLAKTYVVWFFSISVTASHCIFLYPEQETKFEGQCKKSTRLMKFN